MNPKLTITVDAKNRALSVASGMITVGAKIDVEISGLPGDIPPWGTSDAFSGPSVRFRLVDECGRDLARYPLAEGDRWEQSGGVLSSLTPVEFDTDRLRCAFRGVAFDDTLPFGVIVDSAVDAAQYAVGRVKVRQWAAASTEDPTVLPDWRETLERLQKDLAEVSEKRDDAVAAKAAAVSAASEAQSSRNEAAASASSALAANNRAHASASDANDANAAAQKANVAAQEAKTDAQAARDRAEAAAGNIDGKLADYAKKTDVTEAVDVEQRRAKAAEEQNAESAARAKAKADSAQGAAETSQQAADAAQNATNAHAARTDNPHGVTAEQVGAYTKTGVDGKLAKKADKANTLAGYGITDAATKDEVEAKADSADLDEVGRRVSVMEAKVPTHASDKNQLADKDFVNSSITTNTAFYISDGGKPFRSLSDLESYEGVLTNNDYAFVVGRDAEGNTTYTRYKWSSATETWAEEYVLNNSSFTAAQWEAISSGITSGLVAKIGKLPTAEGLTAALAAKADKSALDSHVAKKDNPHAVTAAQVGALPATKKTDVNRYEVSPGVDFLAGFRLTNREDGFNIPVMADVVYNETEEVPTFKITLPPSPGGFIIDFTRGTKHTFLEPDGSDVLTKNSADTIYPTKAALDALANKVDAANAALEEVA